VREDSKSSQPNRSGGSASARWIASHKRPTLCTFTGAMPAEIAAHLGIKRQLAYTYLSSAERTAGVDPLSALKECVAAWGFDTPLGPETSETHPYPGEPGLGLSRRKRRPSLDPHESKRELSLRVTTNFSSEVPGIQADARERGTSVLFYEGFPAIATRPV
jgi:hypothetical protein